MSVSYVLHICIHIDAQGQIFSMALSHSHTHSLSLITIAATF